MEEILTIIIILVPRQYLYDYLLDSQVKYDHLVDLLICHYKKNIS